MMAAFFHEVPTELQDRITAFLGIPEIDLLAAQLHIKSRVEDIILVLTSWRAIVLQAKLPVKIQFSFSFLSVKMIRVVEDKQVVIETDTSSHAFQFSSLDNLEHVIIYWVKSLRKILPDFSPGGLLQNASFRLLARIQRITDSFKEMLQENQGPCGGYSEIYAAFCDYSSRPFQKEIQWLVDNIYHNQECREFNLLDFSHLDSPDVALSVSALSFNRWFTKLHCKDFKLNPDVLEQILWVLRRSVTLEQLVLENCGLKFEFARQLAQVLDDHLDSALDTINLSGNPLEDRGITALSQNFKSLHSLSLARTSLTPKGMIALCRSLVSSGLFRTSLCHLDLSGNPGSLATEDAGGLIYFLSQPNALAHLDLSGTDCALDVLVSALASGCCENLVRLNFSRNVCYHKKNKDAPLAISKFFSKASVLQHVLLSGTKLPPDVLRALMQGLAYNPHLTGLHLDLSGCELKSAGAQVIQDLVSDGSCIRDLNLSDNGFDCDMVTLVLAIGRSRSIRHIDLGENFNIGSRESLADILHRIVQLTEDDDCSVESLSVAESRLKRGGCILLDALGSSSSSRLATLDISGNAMGDLGARSLAKVLLGNTTLRTLVWDRNNTTAYGFLDVTRALERNFTLKTMPLPVNDLAHAYRNHPERTVEVAHQIQTYLTRNQMQERIQFPPGIATGSSDQGGRTPYQNGLSHHKLESLSEVTSQSCSRKTQAVILATQDAVQGLCPQIRQKSSFQDHSVHSEPEKILLDQFLAEVHNKLMEISVSVTDATASGVVDKPLEDLPVIQGTPVYRLAAWEKRNRCVTILPTSDLNSLAELDLKVEAEDNKIGTPQAVLSLRRASVKSRPASTKDAEAEGRLLPRSEPASAQSLMDLPTAGEKLEHYTRDRPRPNRRSRQPPIKPHVQQPVRENDEDRSIARLDEGLDEFFTKKVIQEHTLPISSEASPTVATSTSSGSRTFKKKIGHFFAFKKPKSSRSSRSERESEGSPSTPRGRKLLLGDILKAPSKAGASTKALSKSEEGGLAGESRSHLEQSQTPDSARRVRPKYSREGKSQSLILLSGEDEAALNVSHEKKRPFERSDGELPSSFEQRVHVMLHRIGVTKVLSSEGKKKPSNDGEIKKAGSDGDIVDTSAESPPCSLKSRTHSMSTDPSVRISPAEATGRTDAEPSEGRLSWKTLGKQLNAEFRGRRSELSSSPRRTFVIQEQASSKEQRSRDCWSSSLPRIGRRTAESAPLRRTSNAGEGRAISELQNSCADVNMIAEDNQLKLKPRLKPVANRRAMSVHEEQLREQACAAELHHAKIPLCLQRSPVLKWKIKPKSLLEAETPAPPASPGTPPQEKNMAEPEAKPRAEPGGELQKALEQTLEDAQNTALDQRTAGPLPESPTQDH